MDYTVSINNSKIYIRDHINENLTAEKIAGDAGYSVFHFCRLFKDYEGESLMQYVRNLRLDMANDEIKNGKKASELAFKYGFDTVSGFYRAYEKKFGVRPCKRVSV